MSKVSLVLSSKIFWLFCTVIFSIFLPNPAIALVIGATIALVFDNPVKHFTSKTSKILLQLAVVLLGFGMQFSVILKVGLASLWITMFGIAATFLIGMLICRLFSIDKNISILLTSGTAICGGSAIAAVAPAIGAKQGETAVSMAVVFLLNAVGLVLFPIFGRLLGMSDVDFGLWAALAIHDTSSVVGAAAAYGGIALSIAATVKLTRALWIFPVAFIAGRLNKSEGKPKFQWFLLGFLAAGLIRSLVPQLDQAWDYFALAGKHMMSGTLFLVGAALTVAELKRVGVKSLAAAVILWIIVSGLSLVAIMTGVWSIPADIFTVGK